MNPIQLMKSKGLRPKRVLEVGRLFVIANLRLAAGKIVHGKNLVYSHNVNLPANTVLNFAPGSDVVIGSMFRARERCVLSCGPEGKLEIGNDVAFNYGCQVFCHKRIKIGSGCEFGPGVMLFDHDHDFRSRGGLKENSFKEGEIIIGENTWLGAGVVVLRGTHIGNGCVVGAGCVLKGDYPASSVIVQKRETAVRPYTPSTWHDVEPVVE